MRDPHRPSAPSAPSAPGGAASHVAVVGPGEAPDTLVRLAEEVGRLLAEAGAIVLTGGLGGVMAAASRGASAAGGLAVGFLPGTDRDAAADGVRVAIPTGMGEGRNVLLVRSADAVVCVGGSWGTLSEVALALRTGVPVVSLRGWEAVDADGVIVADGPARADDPAAAVATALELAARALRYRGVGDARQNGG